MNRTSSLLGILLITCGSLLFAWKDGIVKVTAGYYSPVLIIWFQLCCMSAIWLPILIYRHGWNQLIPRPLSWQIARGFSLVTGVGLFYWSVMQIPLADATAVSFVSPLVVVALAPIVLGEKTGFHRWSAVVIGFVGAIILLRPGFAGNSLGYIAAFGAGLGIGFFLITNRKLAHAGVPLASIVYPAYLGSIIISPFIPFNWTTPSFEDRWLIIGFVIISCTAQGMIIAAFRFSQASLIAPFSYVQIVGATLIGYLFFSDLPDLITWIGIIVIVGSGVYIAIRENITQAYD